MVLCTNPTPTGTPNLGCSEEENFIQCQELNCFIAWMWKKAQLWTAQKCYSTIMKQMAQGCLGARCLCGEAPLARQCCSTPVQWDVFCVSFLVGEAAFSFWWKMKVCFPSQRGADLYKLLTLVPDWSILMQMKTTKFKKKWDHCNNIINKYIFKNQCSFCICTYTLFLCLSIKVNVQNYFVSDVQHNG